jgi:hypothetical protein
MLDLHALLDTEISKVDRIQPTTWKSFMPRSYYQRPFEGLPYIVPLPNAPLILLNETFIITNT